MRSGRYCEGSFDLSLQMTPNDLSQMTPLPPKRATLWVISPQRSNDPKWVISPQKSNDPKCPSVESRWLGTQEGNMKFGIH